MYGLINVELLMKFLCLATLENKNSTFAPDICPERNPQMSYPREAYTPEECLAPGSYKNDLKKFTNMVVDIDFLLNIIHNQSNCEICSTVECNREAEEILSYLNENVSPCDDFYEFACGGWLKKHKEEPVSVYSELENHIQVSLKNMLEENITRKNPDFVRKIKGIYRSCMDADRLSIGSEQLKEAVRDLEKWPIRFGKLWDSESFNWMDTLIQLRRKGFSHNTFISLSVVKDPNNNMTNIIE
ncbi:membrane metallo-endopeptidase-like 1, partial [Stegodyphus dumicola]|uniref:membrane metallo-endopeptidase-like 1 n=1 Tax=Stegodyphus dumicola TaxID=202533 RepID=UPI0015AFAE83